MPFNISNNFQPVRNAPYLAEWAQPKTLSTRSRRQIQCTKTRIVLFDQVYSDCWKAVLRWQFNSRVLR